MGRQRQRLGDAGARNAGPPGAGGGGKDPPLSLPKPRFWASGPQNCGRAGFCYFKPLICGNLLWGPQETCSGRFPGAGYNASAVDIFPHVPPRLLLSTKPVPEPPALGRQARNRGTFLIPPPPSPHPTAPKSWSPCTQRSLCSTPQPWAPLPSGTPCLWSSPKPSQSDLPQVGVGFPLPCLVASLLCTRELRNHAGPSKPVAMAESWLRLHPEESAELRDRFFPPQREVSESSCQGHRNRREQNPGGPSAESSGLQRFL